MLSEFKAFAMRGNVMDLAVGVVIGAAFGKIVSSLVGDVIMPPIGLLIGGVDFSAYKWVLKAAGPDGKGEVALQFGAFFNTIIQFAIVALAIFLHRRHAADGADAAVGEDLLEVQRARVDLQFSRGFGFGGHFSN